MLSLTLPIANVSRMPKVPGGPFEQGACPHVRLHGVSLKRYTAEAVPKTAVFSCGFAILFDTEQATCLHASPKALGILLHRCRVVSVHMAEEGEVKVRLKDTFPLVLVLEPLWWMVLQQEVDMVLLPKGIEIVVEDCVQLPWVHRNMAFKVSAHKLPPGAVQANNTQTQIANGERHGEIPGQHALHDSRVQLVERLDDRALSEGRVGLE